VKKRLNEGITYISKLQGGKAGRERGEETRIDKKVVGNALTKSQSPHRGPGLRENDFGDFGGYLKRNGFGLSKRGNTGHRGWGVANTRSRVCITPFA